MPSCATPLRPLGRPLELWPDVRMRRAANTRLTRSSLLLGRGDSSGAQAHESGVADHRPQPRAVERVPAETRMSVELMDGPVCIVVRSGMAPDAALSTENPRGLSVRGLECLIGFYRSGGRRRPGSTRGRPPASPPRALQARGRSRAAGAGSSWRAFSSPPFLGRSSTRGSEGSLTGR